MSNNKNYDNYLKSDKWKSIAEYIKGKDGYTCQMCGKRYSKSGSDDNAQLIVHHKNYNDLNTCGEDVNLDDGHLVTLCSECHKDVHTIVPKLDFAINRFIKENPNPVLSGYINVIQIVVDSCVAARAREFSKFGDVSLLTGGNFGAINKYLTGLLNFTNGETAEHFIKRRYEERHPERVFNMNCLNLNEKRYRSKAEELNRAVLYSTARIEIFQLSTQEKIYVRFFTDPSADKKMWLEANGFKYDERHNRWKCEDWEKQFFPEYFFD